MAQRIPDFHINVEGMPRHTVQGIIDRLYILHFKIKGLSASAPTIVCDYRFVGMYKDYVCGDTLNMSWGTPLSLAQFNELFQFYEQNEEEL